jgi:hypothetical protein
VTPRVKDGVNEVLLEDEGWGGGGGGEGTMQHATVAAKSRTVTAGRPLIQQSTKVFQQLQVRSAFLGGIAS